MSEMKPSSCPSCCSPAGMVDITGCRMSIYPMCDDFVDHILEAVQKIDTSKVWAATDHLSTIYRGRAAHVLDCAQSAFIYAWKKDIHMAGEFTFSRGCPGDSDADRFMETDDNPCNSAAALCGTFHTFAKISFYAFGVAEYMDHIRFIVELAHKRGLKPQSSHYATLLEGNANALFSYFGEVLTYAYQHLPHYVLEATLSVNSPTPVADIREV